MLHRWTPFVRHFEQRHFGSTIALKLDGMIEQLELTDNREFAENPESKEKPEKTGKMEKTDCQDLRAQKVNREKTERTEKMPTTSGILGRI